MQFNYSAQFINSVNIQTFYLFISPYFKTDYRILFQNSFFDIPLIKDTP